MKRPWCWERLRARGEGDSRGWDGWMASLTRWTWVWVDSWGWWWTGRPGVLRFTRSQRVGHNPATELNWTEGARWNNLFNQWQQLSIYVRVSFANFFPQIAIAFFLNYKIVNTNNMITLSMISKLRLLHYWFYSHTLYYQNFLCIIKRLNYYLWLFLQ